MEPTEEMIDPKLRSAIKRVRGGHVASDMLRARVAHSLEQRAIVPRRRVRWVLRAAIAASLLVSGGIIEHVRHHYEEQRNYGAANQALLEAMTRAHAAPLPADAAVVSDLTDPPRVRDELSKNLSRAT